MGVCVKSNSHGSVLAPVVLGLVIGTLGRAVTGQETSPFSFIFALLFVFVVFQAAERLSLKVSPAPSVPQSPPAIAEFLAASEYHLWQSMMMFRGITLVLHTADAEQKEFVVFFPSNHPDIGKAKALSRLDLLGLAYQVEPLPGMRRRYPSAYLRIVEPNRN